MPQGPSSASPPPSGSSSSAAASSAASGAPRAWQVSMAHRSSAARFSTTSISRPRGPATSQPKPSEFSPGPHSRLSPGVARAFGGKRASLLLPLQSTWNSSRQLLPISKRKRCTSGSAASGTILLHASTLSPQGPTTQKTSLTGPGRLLQLLHWAALPGPRVASRTSRSPPLTFSCTRATSPGLPFIGQPKPRPPASGPTTGTSSFGSASGG
mmetsp:Transcript_75292/g.220765  ORF Transcript_75292/g.220765 Transcript_75292/m.220765 type:complete len:212 (+) Transcript_75292:64-699(+)